MFWRAAIDNGRAVAKLRTALALNQIGRRIAELRSLRGWTQEALAERVGVSDKRVQQVESGRKNITVATMVRFANGLDASLTDLVSKPQSSARRRPGRPKST